MKKSNLNYKYTLICPTVDRHIYLSKGINYWSKLPYKLIYVDGSDKEFPHDNLPKDNITYIHMPGASYSDRVIKALDYLDTSYVSMVCDDEFYLPKAINKCIQFLEENPDYNTAMGYPLGFSRSKWFKKDLSYSYLYTNIADRCLSYANSKSRLKSHFGCFEPCHLYAINRSDSFKKNMILTQQLQKEIEVRALGELTFEFLMCASGKSIVLPYLYWLRCQDVPPHKNWQYGNGDVDTRPLSFEDWWKTKQRDVGCNPIEFCKRLEKSDTNSLNYLEIEKIWNVFSSYRESFFPVPFLLKLQIKFSSFFAIKILDFKGVDYDTDEFNNFKKSVLSNA